MDLGIGANTLQLGSGNPSAIWHINGSLLAENVTVPGGAPYVFLTPGLNNVADHTIAIVDPTFLSTGSDIVFDLSQALASVTTARLFEIGSAGGTASGPLAYAPEGPVAVGALSAFSAVDKVAPTRRERAVWIAPFAGGRDFADDASFLGASHRFAGLTGGVDGEATDTLRLGVFASGAASRLEVEQDAQQVETTAGSLGGYAHFDGEGYFLGGVLSAGLSANESRRSVLNNLAPSGIEIAKAEFGSRYVRPEVHVGSRRELSQTVAVVPTAGLNYTAGWVDGYSEAGSSANLNVDDRSLQVLGAQAELPVIYTPETARPLQLTARAEVFARFLLDGDATDVTLLGQNFTIASRDEDIVGLGAGAGFRYGAFGAASLFGSVDVRVASDRSIGGSATGGLRVPF
jgi:uncharacterized protein with beta-barrel porin domain